MLQGTVQTTVSYDQGMTLSYIIAR